RAANTWEVNAAWQEIVDRRAVSLGPRLAKLAMDGAQPNDVRIRALWCLEGVGAIELKQLEMLFAADHRALRKEALRVARAQTARLRDGARLLSMAQRGLADPDRLVRQEAIRLLGRLLEDSRGRTARAPEIVALLANAAANAPEGDWPKFPDFFRDFDRYLIRLEFERHSDLVTAWLDSGAAVPPVTTGGKPAKAT